MIKSNYKWNELGLEFKILKNLFKIDTFFLF